MYTLVVIRHGESQWNKKNLFCGWTDVDLTEQGFNEATQAGKLLKESDFTFDICYTSVLKRAIHTAYTVLDQMDLTWIPVIKNYHLNERHYGKLQGLNKRETTEKYGEEQVHLWRRSYDVRPPSLDENDERNPSKNLPYTKIGDGEKFPLSECLKDTVKRVVPYFESVIKPQILNDKKILIAAHGNSIRALMKYLENISDEEISKVNVPTGIPLVYKLDENFKVISKGYLGNQEEIQKKINAVKNQSKAK